MPISEFHRAAIRGKVESAQSRMSHCTSDLSPLLPDQDFAELLWENGQIVMQGQSSRPKKSLHPSAFSSHSLTAQEKDGADTSIQKFAQFEAIAATLGEPSPAVPCSNIGSNAQVGEIAPWMTSYPIEDTLCSEFFSEFAGINPNSPSMERTNGSTAKDHHSVEPSRLRTNQFFQSSQPCHGSVINNTKSNITKFGFSGGSSSDSAHQSQFQKKELGSSSPKPIHASNGFGSMNFSHFSRPLALAKANVESVDRLRSDEKAPCTVASSNLMESTVIESLPASKINGELVSVEPLKANFQENGSRSNYQKIIGLSSNNRSPEKQINQSSSFATSVVIGRHEAEKGPEAVVASSSMCSDNSAGAASNDLKLRGKRKHLEGEESGYNSEDHDDESIGVKKPTAGRGGMGAKRSRAAEVHNLSERKRRDRINERMRALQELIPNCNKVDKASMLDEAIEYLKALQLQLQMMAMGNGLCMPPMMLPPGMQHMRASPMAHFSPVGFSYGLGMLDMNGSQGFPLIPVPMHKSQLFGIPYNMSLPRPSPFGPFSGIATNSNSMNEAAANPLRASDAGPSLRCNNQAPPQHQSINLGGMKKASTNEPR